jgi:dTMP kinase
MKQEHYPGAFITLEGPDGSGKTSNVGYLAEQFRALGYDVVLTREPGGSKLGEELRALLLSNYMPKMAELLLMYAARADHVEQLIKPALRAGKIVISDRFADSSFAYQGMGRGMKDEVLAIEKLVLGDFEPNWTLYFDVTLDESLKRLQGRTGKSDRFDQEEFAFREKVWHGYRVRFLNHIERMVQIDAMQDPEGVRSQVRAWANGSFMYWHTVTRHEAANV